MATATDSPKFEKRGRDGRATPDTGRDAKSTPERGRSKKRSNYKNRKKSVDCETQTDLSLFIDPSGDEDLNAISASQPNINEVADILIRTRFSFVTGGKALNGSPIITFPDNSQRVVQASSSSSSSSSGLQLEISDYEYRKVINFLCGVLRPLEEDSNPGFVLVIDRRFDKWSSVKSALAKISCFFPGAIDAAYVVRPSGFLQRALGELTFKMIKDECKFKVILCSSVEELHNYVERQELSSDLNGSIQYNHDQWVEQRQAVENFGSKVNEVRFRAKKFSTRLPEVELPNDVATTEDLLRNEQGEYREIKSEMGRSVRQGEQLMTSITGLTLSRESLKLNPDKRLHVDELEKMLTTLESSQRKLEESWKDHEDKLLQCLQLRRFEQEFRELRSAMQRHLELLRRATDVGDSVLRVETLLREIRGSEKDAKEELKRAEQLVEGGEYLIDSNHYAIDSIRPKCRELQLLCDEYSVVWRRQYERLKRSHALHEKLEAANVWCHRGMEFLAAQQIERFQTVEGADQAMRDVEDFVANRPSDNLVPTDAELDEIFQGDVPETARLCAASTRQRLDDVMAMCEKRRLSLRRLNKKQTMTGKSRGETETHNAGAPPVGTVAPIPRTEIRVEGFHGSPIPSPRARRAASGALVAGAKKSTTTAPSCGGGGSGGGGGGGGRISDHDKQKQGHVMRELIETERNYVEELKAILEGYAAEMDNPSARPLLPEPLVGKKEILFGNLDVIADFHADVFLKDLETCKETPHLVGTAFVKRSDEFDIYCQYCKNKPSSESLRREVGETNEFFKKCQQRLGHKLPLGAYLLKPVQRITKYQLLLKEMLKYMNPEDKGYEEMENAKDNMLKVIKHVNDVMHQIAITGYKGDISELGNLLMQGPFNVWTEHKGSGLKDLRFKPMQRHLFLFEKGMILCKKTEASTEPPTTSSAATPDKRPAPKSAVTADKISYQFKNRLDMAHVGLTENVQSDKKKFEIWVNQRAEVYILQAPSVETKDQWVEEIKLVLLRQFDAIKASHQSTSRLPKVKDLVVASSSGESSATTTPTDAAVGLSAPALTSAGRVSGGVIRCEPSALEAATPTTHPRNRRGRSKGGWTLGGGGSGGAAAARRHSGVSSLGSAASRPTSAEYNEFLSGGAASSAWSSGDEYDDDDDDVICDDEFDESVNFVGRLFTSLADYHAVDVGELTMTEGQTVEVVKDPPTPPPLKVGSEGWWFVRVVSTGDEGWAPASYLERCHARTSSLVSSGGLMRRRSSERASFGSGGGVSSPIRRNSARSTISMNSLDSVDSTSQSTPCGSATPTNANVPLNFDPTNKRDSGYSTVQSGYNDSQA